MGNVISLDSRREIEDLANSILSTFAHEYSAAYGCEVLRLNEENEECKFPFSLNFCPWERLRYPIKKGYLTKQGYIRRSWRRRYFVVQPNYSIEYYENEEAFEKGMKPKGVIHPCGYKVVSNLEDALAMRQKELAAIFEVDEQGTPEKFPDYTFGIIHDKARSYFITVENEEEKMEWVKVFQLCCACVKGFTVDDAVCQSAYNKAILRTLMGYGNAGYHSYKGTEEKILCDIITAEIEERLLIGIYRNVKGSFAAKSKTRDQVLKDLEVSVQTLVSPVWKKLLEDKENIHLKAEAILREKKAEVATCQRKIEWKMSGKTDEFIDETITEVRSYAQKLAPFLEKSMIDALCEVRSIYQANIVEIAIDVEQREEIEIPLQMYINSMDMLARTPSEMETAYKNLEVMKEVLKKACDDLKSFDVSAVVGQAEEKLRMVMDALVNTFQQRFLCLCRDIKGNQQHKQLRNVIEEVDEEVANNFEADLKEIITTFILRILKTIFVPFVHKKVDVNCKRVIESLDVVIPEHLTFVITLNDEYEKLVERSVEQSLKEAINKTDDESRQRSFVSSMRSSRRKTFPKFLSRRTKFQSGLSISEESVCMSLPVKKDSSLNGEQNYKRKPSLSKLIGLGCLPIDGDWRKSTAYTPGCKQRNIGGDTNLEEIISNLDIQNGGSAKIKR